MITNDANILLSIINTKLRDFYKSLDDLCEDMDESSDEIQEILGKINYIYDKEKNRFILKKESNFNIGDIPCLLYGNNKNKVYIYVHGRCGNKEEANNLYSIIGEEYDVLSFDLPGHGKRENISDFVPWKMREELDKIYNYALNKWESISLYANSIGAYTSLITYYNKKIDKALLVSPIVNMQYLIENMMKYQNVSIEELKEKKQINDLSLEYYNFTINNKINSWNIPTYILYGEKDNLMSIEEITKFKEKFNCELEVMIDGEHWFHTPIQLEVLNTWIKKYYK